MQCVFAPTRLRVGFGLLLALALAPAAHAAGWGTVKGSVVVEGAVPARKAVAVTKDQDHCLKNGPLLSEDYVVNPKNKGVRWVMVWLVDAQDPKKPLPIAPSLAKAKSASESMDHLSCRLEPHVLALREGQALVVKNSAAVTHNVNITGGVVNPNVNYIMPPETTRTVSGWTASTVPVLVTCNIHPWMKAYIRVFKHPYYAITDENGAFEIKDAPAGEYHLVTWQESVGWVQGGKLGTPITIKDGGVTDVGPITLKPE